MKMQESKDPQQNKYSECRTDPPHREYPFFPFMVSTYSKKDADWRRYVTFLGKGNRKRPHLLVHGHRRSLRPRYLGGLVFPLLEQLGEHW